MLKGSKAIPRGDKVQEDGERESVKDGGELDLFGERIVATLLFFQHKKKGGAIAGQSPLH